MINAEHEVQLYCSISKEVPVRWYRGSERAKTFIEENEKYRFLKAGNHLALMITNATEDDDDTYGCELNHGEKTETTVTTSGMFCIPGFFFFHFPQPWLWFVEL